MHAMAVSTGPVMAMTDDRTVRPHCYSNLLEQTEPYSSAANTMTSPVSAETDFGECQSSDPSMAIELLPPAGKIECGGLEEASTGKQLLKGLERILMRWARCSPTVTSASQRKSGFFSPRVPRISIENYLSRNIYKCFQCSDECYVLALVYINRITKMEPSITVCNLSMHRLLLFAVLVAAKFHDDLRYGNIYYAKVGGLPIAEVNKLELKFLQLIDWKTVVDAEEYQFYHALMCQASNPNSLKHVLQNGGA
jgi:hypothetical protein